MPGTLEKSQAKRHKSPTSERLRQRSSPPTLLPMGKRAWSHTGFMKYLDNVARMAGIPNSKRGTPNTTIFEEYTDVSPTQVGRWRAGTSQPTTDSLRMIANGLGPKVGMDPAQLLINLEVKAGRRSKAEAEVTGADVGEPTGLEAEYERYLYLLRTAVSDPHVSEADRVYFQRHLRSAAREYEEILAEREAAKRERSKGDAA